MAYEPNTSRPQPNVFGKDELWTNSQLNNEDMERWRNSIDVYDDDGRSCGLIFRAPGPQPKSVSKSPFSETIDSFLDAASPRLCASPQEKIAIVRVGTSYGVGFLSKFAGIKAGVDVGLQGSSSLCDSGLYGKLGVTLGMGPQDGKGIQTLQLGPFEVQLLVTTPSELPNSPTPVPSASERVSVPNVRIDSSSVTLTTSKSIGPSVKLQLLETATFRDVNLQGFVQTIYDGVHRAYSPAFPEGYRW